MKQTSNKKILLQYDLENLKTEKSIKIKQLNHLLQLEELNDMYSTNILY